MIRTIQDAKDHLVKSFPQIINECRQILGSELHYQAMIYHCLRSSGQVPLNQIGMNVKMRITDPVSDFFQALDAKRQHDYQGMVEPIPDICVFDSAINGNWQRRNADNTLASLLLAIEIKAAERENSKLQTKEIFTDIRKLEAHQIEARHRGHDFYPVMMIIDTAVIASEQITYRG